MRSEQSGRVIVAYNDCEFGQPRREHIDDLIRIGATDVVFCWTEEAAKDKTRALRDAAFAAEMRDAGLRTMADPWGVGGVCGGEGRSEFREAGVRRCYICNPAIKDMFLRWGDSAGMAGFDTVFLDEPQVHCGIHGEQELEVVQEMVQSVALSGLHKVVCLCANERKLYMLDRVAAMPEVAEIATDPYVPNAFSRIPPGAEARRAYIRRWIATTGLIADRYDKPFHIWVQLFGIPKYQPDMIAEHLNLVMDAGADPALWAYGGSASVPGFRAPQHVPPEQAWATAEHAMSTRRSEYALGS